MRMIESIDSDDMVSSKDMWAEICPSSTDLQETNPPDNFSDSFLCPDPGAMPESNSSSYSPKPWAPLQDSEVCFAALAPIDFLFFFLFFNSHIFSKLEHLKRWLQPEKVAISAEEVQCLIPGESPSIEGENKELDSVEQ
ncbi:coiled-coil domain-containing protein 32-like [Ranitomeya imitator]|uniref:coiled-coil domain-containing protein 32-like n=1 Tax=Ranitomeya imitator TaxID=111125 RepID=UPI0037E89589